MKKFMLFLVSVLLILFLVFVYPTVPYFVDLVKTNVFREELEQIQNEKDKLEEEKAAFQEGKAALEEQVGQLSSENESLQNRIEALSAEKKELQEKASANPDDGGSEESTEGQEETQSDVQETDETEAPVLPERVAKADTTKEYTSRSAVRMVQQALNEEGYSCGTADGVAGTKTKNAVLSYEKEHGLAENGIITDQLLESLNIAGQVRAEEEAESSSASAKADEPSSTAAQAADEVNPELKEFLDQYESVMNEYCDFMKSYDASDTGSLFQYLSLLEQYTEFAEKAEKYEQQDLSGADLSYYLEVTARVEKKLLDLLDE